jgi:pimeloyl-ACP methyl ester carboxylesterase
MATFVLISGAWHGAWCWDLVVPRLTAAGHKVVAPDLIGMGDDPTPPAHASLAAWGDQVAELIRAEAEPVILVGHSRGGLVISEAAERVPERITTLVYLAAFLIPSGRSLGEVAAENATQDAPQILLPQPDGTALVRPEAVGPVFYNLTPPDLVELAQSKLGPEPMSSFGTPVMVTPERFGVVPRVYIECAEDRALPIASQRAMQAALPCASVFTLKSDHSPFFSQPTELAEILLRLAQPGGG